MPKEKAMNAQTAPARKAFKGSAMDAKVTLSSKCLFLSTAIMIYLWRMAWVEHSHQNNVNGWNRSVGSLSNKDAQGYPLNGGNFQVYAAAGGEMKSSNLAFLNRLGSGLLSGVTSEKILAARDLVDVCDKLAPGKNPKQSPQSPFYNLSHAVVFGRHRRTWATFKSPLFSAGANGISVCPKIAGPDRLRFFNQKCYFFNSCLRRCSKRKSHI